MKKTILFLIFCFKVFFIYAQNISITQIKAACNYDGIVEIDINDVNFPFFISYWYEGGFANDTINNATDLPITINDFGGGMVTCYVYSNSSTVTHSETFTSPFEVAIETTQAVCPTLGTATVIITGGTAPFAVEWIRNDDGSIASTDNPASLPNGYYSVQVTDNDGCVIKSAENRDSSFAYIYATPNFTFDVETRDADCTDGSAKIVNIQGGSPPFTYKWSNGSNASELFNLTKGFYNVEVTGSDGCTNFSKEVIINQSIEIVVDITQTPVTCQFNNGNLHAFPSGGKPPYQYIWSNGDNTAKTENLASGNFNVKVIDADGCIGEGYTYLSSFSPVNVQIVSVMPTTCNASTGSITITASGGQGPYNVNWLQYPNEHNFTLNNLSEGNYSFIVTDANGCNKNGTVYVSSNPPFYLVFNISYPSCDNPDGQITANLNGGTQPYDYKWNDGSNTATLSNIKKGVYQLTITDANGCAIEKSIYIPSSSPLTLSFGTTNASCIYNSDGAIIANIQNGTAPYTYTWSNGGNTSGIGNLKSGEYRLAVKDAMGCEGYGYTFVDYDPSNNSCYCLLTGTTYLDANENCVKDGNEQPIQHLQIKVKNFGYVYSNTNGVYEIKLPTGTYQVTETVKTKYPLSDCEPNNNTYTVVAGANCVLTKDFANILNPIRDLNINLWPVSKPIPGYGFDQKLIVSNQGTINEGQIITKLNIEDQIPFFIDNPITFVQENANNYIGDNIPTLKPGENYNIDITYTTPVDIPLGTEVIYLDSCAYDNDINNWLNDYSPADNVGIHRDLVVGSYDPNFIEVHPQGQGEEGYIKADEDIQNYMVHFENEGSWYAQKVVVKVYLDPAIDIESIEPIYQSHPASVMIENDGTLMYIFNNIQLHPKAWGSQSQGMFSFRCKLKEGRQAGDKIRTSADIYFDFNAPVATNKTLNTIEKLSAINENSTNSAQFTITPNPSTNFITIRRQSDEISNFEIQSLSGIKVLQSTLIGFENTIDISALLQGLYIIREINTNGKSYGTKFLKI